MDTSTVAGIKPATFWLQDGPANHRAARVEAESEGSIDRLPPAARIIIEQLFGASDALLATELTRRRDITHLLLSEEEEEGEFRVSRAEDEG